MARKRLEETTPEQRAAIEAIRARNATPERRAEERRIREEVRAEVPPLTIDPGLAEALAGLKRERERLGLSLADVQERSGLDRAFVSRLENGKVANPTVATLSAYARALGKRVAWSLEPAGAGE